MAPSTFKRLYSETKIVCFQVLKTFSHTNLLLLFLHRLVKKKSCRRFLTYFSPSQLKKENGMKDLLLVIKI